MIEEKFVDRQQEDAGTATNISRDKLAEFYGPLAGDCWNQSPGYDRVDNVARGWHDPATLPHLRLGYDLYSAA